MITSTPFPGANLQTPVLMNPPGKPVPGRSNRESSSQPNTPSRTSGPTATGGVSLVDYHGPLASLAATEPHATAYWRAAVRKIAGQSSILGFAMHGHRGSESLADFASVEQIGNETRQKLKGCLQQAAVECECHGQAIYQVGVQIEQLAMTVIAIPVNLPAPRDLRAVVCFALRPLEANEIALPAQRLHSLLLQAAMHLPIVTPDEQETSKATKSLEMIGRTAAYRDTREFAYALVGSLASRYGCSKVALGLAGEQHVRVLAISGMDQFKSTSPGVIDVQQAMEETYDTQAVVGGDSLAKSDLARSMPIHQRWATTTRTAVVSFPLFSGEQCVAVLTFQRDPNLPWTDQDIGGLQRLVEPFGPAIALSVRGDRGLGEHVRSLAKQSLAQIRQPKTKVGSMVRALALTATLLFFLGWMPYRPTTPCVIVPANMHQSIAGFDMKLAETMVRSGDLVQRGQVLARFDTRELELERSRLIASRNQAEVDVRRALSLGDAASASLAKATSRAFQCQLDTVESKIVDCTVTAPADGMILEADLATKIGQVFAKGELILSFAPMDQWELQLQVPERLARFIDLDQPGSFAPIATPGVKHPYRIDNVSGAAEVVDGKNVIIAKAIVDGAPAELRHGMKGVARTHTGWRPVCWVALHGVYEFFCDLMWL